MILPQSGEQFNPLKITEDVHKKYLQFVQTSFAPNNPILKRKLEQLTNKGLLWREPYISISHRYKKGRPFRNFIEIHNMSSILLDCFRSENLYLHQEKSIANIISGKNTVIASGTGSGKTEIFFIPMLNHCINNRSSGIKTIIVYPMNALANDQIDRLRDILYTLNSKIDKPITFAIYTRQTPRNRQTDEFKQMIGVPLICPQCKEETLRVTSNERGSFLKCENSRIPNHEVKIEYQILTRDELINNVPDILITNYVQLQYLMLRKQDEKLFQGNRLQYLILDEIHAYGGARGIDVSLLIRRLKKRILDNGGDPICIGTSATLSTYKSPEKRKEDIADFAQKLFGVGIKSDEVFEGEREELYRPQDSIIPDHLIESIGNLDDIENLEKICKLIDPRFIPRESVTRITAAKLLQKNRLFQDLLLILQNPHTIKDISEEMTQKEEFQKLFKTNSDSPTLIWNYLKLGTLLPNPDIPNRFVPLIRVNVHNFFKSMESIFCCINCHKLFSIQRDNCDECKSIVEELGVCRFCGRQYFIAFVDKDAILSFINFEEEDGFLKLIGKSSHRNVLKCTTRRVEKDSSEQEIWETQEKVDEEFPIMKKCLKCGSYSSETEITCQNQQSDDGVICGSNDFKEIHLLVKKIDGKQGLQAKSPPHHCPFCQNSYGISSALSKTYMSPNTASGTLFDLVYEELPDQIRKMLIFTDSIQSASHFSGQLEMDHLTHTIRNLLYTIVKEASYDLSYRELKDEAFYRINAWYDGDMEKYDVKARDIYTIIDEELTSVAARQRSIENLGLIQVNYRGTRSPNEFEKLFSKQQFDENLNVDLNSEASVDIYRKYLISILNILRTAGAFGTLSKRKYPDEYPVGFYMASDSEGFTKPDKIKLVNIFDGKPLEFTTKVFNVDKDIAKRILRFSFDFLTKNYLMISKDLQYGNNKPVKGYFVINENTTYVGLAKEIFRCNKCLKIFSNIPNDKCISWRCDGQTEKIDSKSYASENEQYYYRKYSNSDPIRMVTEEDTGALDPNKRRSVELNFKETDPQKRKIDVIVATPTLELGVDIGDLHAVGLYKTPPNPISYFQRVGRAGRTTGLSLNNTFVFQNSIDNYYYRNPSEMIKGEVRPPYINLYNPQMIQRHANAIIIEFLFVHSSNRDEYPQRVSEFVKDNALEIMKNEIKENRDEIFSRIRVAFNDLSMLEIKDKDIEKMIENFENSMVKSIEKYNDDLIRYEKRKEHLEMIHENDPEINKMKQKSYLDIGDQIWRLQHSDILNHLMDTGVLPRYAFPGLYVNLEDEYGRVSFSGRSRNTAITEYAPGMEVYAMKRIFRSSGVDIKFTKPHEQLFYVCQGCNKFVSKEPFDSCKICSQNKNSKMVNAISPDVIYLRDTQKRITESRDYQEANLDIFLSTEKVKSSKKFENLKLSKFGNIEIVQIVSSIFTSDTSAPKQIELCSLCGRAKDENNQERHRIIGGKEYCRGEYQSLSIYHEMPTNVISVSLSGETLFGVPIEGIGPGRRIFLVTLKNAIINAAQLVAQAEQGEIDGVVKNDELILYDNVEGGVGYVDVIYDRFDEIIDKAAEMVLDESKVFGEECQHGCPKCLWSYRRKRDIPSIDKQSILPILSPAREYVRLQNTRKEIMQDSLLEKDTNIDIIYSPSYRYFGLLELRNKLRSASKVIKLTSMYVTDDKILWPDEEEKSWVDILCGIKKENSNISITLIIREPQSISHKKSLIRLREWGVRILIYKNEAEQRYKDGIVHSKLVVIDPLDRDYRCAFHMSGNLSAEMEKNHETFHMSQSEDFVINTWNEITKIEQASRDLSDSDLLFPLGQRRINIKPGDGLAPIKKDIGIEIGNAQKIISIMDPYLGKIEELFSYLNSWLRKDVQIRIITSKIESKEVAKVKEKYEKDGYNIKIIRYFDRDRITGRETILHDRYILVDEKKAIILGKGVNTFLEDSEVSRDNVTVEILEIPSEVRKCADDFREFWDYRNSHNSVIKSFPKNEY